MKTLRLYNFPKTILLIFALILTTLMLNIQIITYNMMYFEQPLLYTANQHVHTFYDLLQRYAHPQLLALTVPFFRPSGHFLMYYLLTPLFGWHNNQAFIIVNLIFLSLCGFFIILIYQCLFHKMLGGFIACAIFLMHPAMLMSRITVMHFDYAYIFFSLAALYFFIVFVQDDLPAKNFARLALSLVLFVIACTFKEPALMLGPVFCSYFLVFNHEKNFSHFIRDSQTIKVLLLITVVTCVMFLYLTLPWPGILNHPTGANSWGKKWWALQELIKILLCVQTITKVIVWHLTAASVTARSVMVMGFALLFLVFFSNLSSREKISLTFLFTAASLFLALPVAWAMAMPWHLSLTLIAIALAMGFAFEKCIPRRINFFLIFFIASITVATNYLGIQLVESRFGKALALNKNAIFSPPAIQDKLNAESVIVVEDNVIQNPYLLGNSRYPYFLAQSSWILDFVRKWEKNNFLQSKPTFNGNLFKFAYLIPTLREEEYPFSVDKMHVVSDEILYTWLQHFNNIFCFGYDVAGHWHDKTALFKRNLLAEQALRHIPVNSYQVAKQQRLIGKPLMDFLINIPDHHACEMKCDTLPQCKSIVMYKYKSSKLKSECVLFSEAALPRKYCNDCTVFFKRDPR